MGADHSMNRGRAVSFPDESMRTRFRNNYRALHFHHVHGENIKLSKDRTVAFRSEGFCRSLAFSDRPVTVLEFVYVKFLEISNNWSGALRIGFTMHDPVSLKSKLPRYACPDLTSMNGNWAKAIDERLAKKDSILFYYVDANGDVHYGVDFEEYGIFFGGVNTSGKLWSVLDIYGNTVAVEFVDPYSVISDLNDDTENLSLTSLRPANNPHVNQSVECNNDCTYSFHNTHGINVTLKRNRSVASRKPGFHTLAYAFTNIPLKVNEQLLCQVLKLDNFQHGSLLYGITSCNPLNIDPCELPENPDELLDRPEYWVVKEDSYSYKMKDIITFNLNPEGEITVKLKGEQKSSVFHVDPTLPLWLFINMAGSVSEVKLLGTATSDSVLAKQMEQMRVSLPDKSEDTGSKPGTSGHQPYSECVICYEETVDCALYKCGHVCMCYKCAMVIWKPNSDAQCPICRERILDIIKIYP